MRLKKLSNPTDLVALASMTRPDHAVDASELARIHRVQGYSRIAVHFVIERDGRVVEGRPTELPGCLAGPRRNATALQACLIGGLDAGLCPANTFTPEQYASLTSLAERLQLPLTCDEPIHQPKEH